MLNREEISTVIFDLGAVIVDLDYLAVIDEISKHTDLPPEKIYQLIVSSDHLFDFETGQLDEPGFVEGVCSLLNTTISQAGFQLAWNKMLKDIPLARLNLMREVGKRKTTMILSNTNVIHKRKFDEMVSQLTGEEGMHRFVHHAYYSHEIMLRKPDEDVYRYILDKHNLRPGEVLFLDDNADNIASAQTIGINAVRVEYPDQIFEILGDG